MGDETYQSYRDDRSRVVHRLHLVERETQKHHLATVSSRIQGAIIDFCKSTTGTFHADDLRKYVTDVCGQTAPGSADRVLRDLRAKGIVSYVVVNRAKSLYQIFP